MKVFNLRIIFLFFVSLSFCSEDEKYSLIFGERVVGEKIVQTHSEEISFTLPGIGYVEYVSSLTSVVEFLGIEGDFWKFKATLTEVENNNIVNGIEILDQYAEAMEDNSCYLYVKSSGSDVNSHHEEDEVHHIEPVKEEDYYLLEAFESAYMGVQPNHFRYPFGREAVDVTKGDSWSLNLDSLKFYVNMGSPSSLGSSKPKITLKKVKEKRGRKVAYIDYITEYTFDLRIAVNFLGERRLITGQANGIGDGGFKWDVEEGEFLSQVVVINLAGDFEMDGEKVYMKVFMRTINKKVK